MSWWYVPPGFAKFMLTIFIIVSALDLALKIYHLIKSRLILKLNTTKLTYSPNFTKPAQRRRENHEGRN